MQEVSLHQRYFHPAKYELLGNLAHGPVTICTTPAVAGGRLYLRQKTRLACYDVAAP